MRYRIACIDDEPEVLELYDEMFSDDFEFYSTYRADEFNSHVVTENPHAVLVDLVMPDINGAEILEGIKKKHDCLRIVITGCSDGNLHSKAKELSHRIYTKPIKYKSVVEDIKFLLKITVRT